MRKPWMKFYPADWRDPRLRQCSLAARGLWIDLMSYMHEAEPYGHLLIVGKNLSIPELALQLSRPGGEVKRAMRELEVNGVFSKTGDGTIFSRRMVRDFEKAAKDQENGLQGGHPDIKRGTVPKEQRVRRFRRSDAPLKAQRIFDRSAGACHWCQKQLDPDHYHIDHVIAVRDGGTNDESNLVAACPECNGERAVTLGRSDSDLMVGNSADHKAQKLEARSQNPEKEIKNYAFESGVVRLNERDFSNWKASFSYLDVPAELVGMSEWAAEQESWFHAVKGLLAKRNRKAKAKADEAARGGGFRTMSGIDGVI